MRHVPLLLVDLDGVVADIHQHATDLGHFDHRPCRWSFSGCCTQSTENDIFANTAIFRDAPVMAGALDGISRLKAEFTVMFVSTPWKSNPEVARAKYEWFEEHFGDPAQLILCYNKALIPAWGLVDDKPNLRGPWHHIEYPQPWNNTVWPTWENGLARAILEFKG